MLEYDLLEAEEDGDRWLNAEIIADGEMPEVGPWIIEKLLVLDSCPYCRHPMRHASHHWQKGEAPRDWDLVHCPNCAYWQFFGKHWVDAYLHSYIYWEAYIPRARSFEELLPLGCETELAQALRRDRRLWSSLEPRRLETLVAEILRANYKPCEVVHLGMPHDGGVDVLLIDADGRQWVVQVKRRSTGAGESVNTLRNLLGVMYEDKELRGIVVSTADHFTHHARALRRRVAAKGGVIELVDRGKLNLMLSPLIPERPWALLYDEYVGVLETGLDRRSAFRAVERKLHRVQPGQAPSAPARRNRAPGAPVRQSTLDLEREEQ